MGAGAVDDPYAASAALGITPAGRVRPHAPKPTIRGGCERPERLPAHVGRVQPAAGASRKGTVARARRRPGRPGPPRPLATLARGGRATANMWQLWDRRRGGGRAGAPARSGSIAPGRPQGTGLCAVRGKRRIEVLRQVERRAPRGATAGRPERVTRLRGARTPPSLGPPSPGRPRPPDGRGPLAQTRALPSRPGRPRNASGAPGPTRPASTRSSRRPVLS